MNEKDPLKSGAMESSLWELNVKIIIGFMIMIIIIISL